MTPVSIATERERGRSPSDPRIFEQTDDFGSMKTVMFIQGGSRWPAQPLDSTGMWPAPCGDLARGCLGFEDGTNPMQPERHDDNKTPLSSPAASCDVEVSLPMPVSHAWVAYACRTAGVAKPRWNPASRVWTTSAKGASGVNETISITSGTGPKSVRVQSTFSTSTSSAFSAPPDQSGTARRLVTAFVTGMQWAVRRRS